MKKIIYSLVMVSILFLGIQEVDAAVSNAHCEYRTKDSKTITVDVKYDPDNNVVDSFLNKKHGEVNISFKELGSDLTLTQNLKFEDFLDIDKQKMKCLPNIYYFATWDSLDGVIVTHTISFKTSPGAGYSEATLNTGTASEDTIISDNQTSNDNITTSDRYAYLLGSLIVPLKNIDSSMLNQKIRIKGEMVALNTLTENNALCESSDCDGKASIKIDEGMKQIAKYCENVFDKKASSERQEECVYFVKDFKNVLVANNVVEDYTGDCGFLSNEIVGKLKSFLKIFSIAAPLLAIGLGTVDFIKVIAVGDADKELKNAGKRLLTRLIAAVLLLVIPTIIAFLLDTFLGNSEGYDPDNPFCNIVDKWGDE